MTLVARRPRRDHRQLARPLPVSAAQRLVSQRAARRIPDLRSRAVAGRCALADDVGRRRDQGRQRRCGIASTRRTGRGRRIRRGRDATAPSSRRPTDDGIPASSRRIRKRSSCGSRSSPRTAAIRDLGAVLHAAQDSRGPARRAHADRQRAGARRRDEDRRLGAQPAVEAPPRAVRPDVEHVHRRRVRRRQRRLREPARASRASRSTSPSRGTSTTAT